MRNLVRVGALVVPCVVVVFWSLLPSPRRDFEADRLRAHFAAVERELLTRDVSRLSPAQRAARSRNVERLRAYAAAGVFPTNTDFPGRMVPYFVDRVGTRCAMAYLIEHAGGADLVARVAATRSNALITELADDGALVAWLDRNGLSLAEAARIQPAYCGDPDPLFPCPDRDPHPSTAYKIGTGSAVLGSVATLSMNAHLLDLGLSRRASGWLGIGTGLAGLGLGLTQLDAGEHYETLVAVNVVAGILSLVSGAVAVRHAPQKAARRSPVHAAPWLQGRAAGIALRYFF